MTITIMVLRVVIRSFALFEIHAIASTVATALATRISAE